MLKAVLEDAEVSALVTMLNLASLGTFSFAHATTNAEIRSDLWSLIRKSKIFGIPYKQLGSWSHIRSYDFWSLIIKQQKTSCFICQDRTALMFGISHRRVRSLESHRTSRMLAPHMRSYGFWNLARKAQIPMFHMSIGLNSL